MNKTENYALNQWDAQDKVQRADFNADNVRLDAALSGLAAADGAINTALSGKADVSALSALSQTVSGHTSALALKGNCQIWTTTYTGTGGFGVDYPNRITFPKKPLLVMIYPHGSSQVSWIMPIDGIMAHTYSNRASWSGSTVSWYCYETVHDASFQLNHKGSTYLVIAFIPADQ